MPLSYGGGHNASFSTFSKAVASVLNIVCNCMSHTSCCLFFSVFCYRFVWAMNQVDSDWLITPSFVCFCVLMYTMYK